VPGRRTSRAGFRHVPYALSLLLMQCGLVSAQVPVLSLESLPRPATPPAERGPVVPAQVSRWRQEALAYEHGEGVARDPVAAAQLYCRAARYGDAEAQFNLAWMLTNARGIERDDAQAAHLFAAAAEQGLVQAQNMARAMGTPRGAPPPCLRPPETDLPLAASRPEPLPKTAPQPVPPPPNAPPPHDSDRRARGPAGGRRSRGRGGEGRGRGCVAWASPFPH